MYGFRGHRLPFRHLCFQTIGKNESIVQSRTSHAPNVTNPDPSEETIQNKASNTPNTLQSRTKLGGTQPRRAGHGLEGLGEQHRQL